MSGGGPVAVDVMGGDHAPDAVLEGAVAAAGEGLEVLLVGPPGVTGPTGLPARDASEVIAMDEDPASGVRRKKDSTLVRAAEAVRDGEAAAMVSAGNTGAAMAAALLRMGRIRGVARPAIATPIPRPDRPTPTVLIDAGANADCRPEWLAQFARMGGVFARLRYGIAEPRIGLLSIGEEDTKGDELVKAARPLVAAVPGYIGNVEGRDIMGGDVDVVVTDGFTGNVALKTLEGAMRALIGALLEVFDADDEARAASAVLWDRLAPLYHKLDPDTTGGAALLGVRGVCVISHGSSSARAITNAIRVAHDLAGAGIVDALAEAVAD